MSKYGHDTSKKICDSIKAHKGRVVSCQEAGITYDTFTRWMSEKPEFSESIKEAEEHERAFGKDFAVKAIFRAMPVQWQAAAWWLERNHKEFIKKEAHDYTSQGDSLKPVIPIIVQDQKTADMVKAIMDGTLKRE